MKKINLVKLVGISNGIFAKLVKNESVSLSVIDNICIALDYKIENVVEIKNG